MQSDQFIFEQTLKEKIWEEEMSFNGLPPLTPAAILRDVIRAVKSEKPGANPAFVFLPVVVWKLDHKLVATTIHARMGRKAKLVTPKEYAEMNGVAYTTVMYWLQTGKVEGAVKHETPRGPYWELPEDTPRPKKLSGRPKKSAKKSKKRSAK